MMMSQQEKEDPDQASWLRTLYQIAHSDTRWTKEQGWRVVNWTLLLYGAVLGTAKYLLPKLSSTVFIFVDMGVLIVALIYLVKLHLSAAGTRRTAARIEDRIPPDVVTLLERRTQDTYHNFYLGIELAVVVVAFILVAAAHLHLASTNVAA